MFIEETKEFLVTNSVNKVGIIDENGQNKIEQIYDSIICYILFAKFLALFKESLIKT